MQLLLIMLSLYMYAEKLNKFNSSGWGRVTVHAVSSVGSLSSLLAPPPAG